MISKKTSQLVYQLLQLISLTTQVFASCDDKGCTLRCFIQVED